MAGERLEASIPLDGGPCRVRWEQAGMQRSIQVMPQDLAGMLVRTQEANGGAVGQLRPEDWVDLLGTRSGCAVRKATGIVQIVLSVAPGPRQLYVGTAGRNASYKHVTVNLPALCWMLQYVNKTLQRTHLFVCQRQVLSLREVMRVRSFPWGNVNQGSGHVCWGSVSIEQLKPEDPWLVDELFFQSKLNDHLWHDPLMGWQADNRHWDAWLANHAAETLRVDWEHGTTTLASALGQLGRGEAW